MAIKALFLDFGNVFSTFVFDKFFHNLRNLGHTSLSIEELDTIANRHYYHLDRGAISRREYYHRFASDMGATLSQEQFEQCFLDIFTGHVDELESILKHVREHTDVDCFLLSNTNEIHYERYIREHPFLFTYVHPRNHVLSYRVGASKPDRKIYAHAIDRAGCHPSETFFVDDLESNITAWKELGGHGVVWHGGEHAVEILEEALHSHGMLKQKRA